MFIKCPHCGGANTFKSLRGVPNNVACKECGKPLFYKPKKGGKMK